MARPPHIQDTEFYVALGRALELWQRVESQLYVVTSVLIEQYVVDVEHDIHRPLASYDIKLHAADKFAINNLITIFELISGVYE